jgi:segregation and condensation protein B
MTNEENLTQTQATELEAAASTEELTQEEETLLDASEELLLEETDTQAVVETGAVEENPNLITDETEIQRALEALVFASPKAISLKRIKGILGSFNYDTRPVVALLDKLIDESQQRGFQLVKVAGAYQYRSNPTQSDILQKLLEDRPVRLGASALEVLAIVAYKQPVSRSEIDAIRGVDSGHLTRGLLDKNLIRTVGHAETPGRPLLYGTTPYFLEVFTLDSLDDMPSLEDFDRELAAKKDNEANINNEESETLENSDPAALEDAAIFFDRASPLAANPDRGNFDAPAEDDEEKADFGLQERAAEEVNGNA